MAKLSESLRRLNPFRKKASGPKPLKRKKKGFWRETLDIVVKSVIAAVLIKWLLFDAVNAPTESMENTVLVNDYLLVSKFHYGARTPLTPLQVPLTHSRLWRSSTPSYWDGVRLPYWRLPGVGSVKRGDVVMFNYPPEHRDGVPVDQRMYVVKRCMALPGDTIQLLDGNVVIGGKALPAPRKARYKYLVNTVEAVRQGPFFARRGIQTTQSVMGSRQRFVVNASDPEAKALLEADDSVSTARKYYYPRGEAMSQVYPFAPDRFPWNPDQFGPLYIPKAGDRIPVNDSTLILYDQLILHHEGHENAKVENGTLYISGKEVKEYAFRRNYYFMLGDNRGYSEDSRFWGLVPEDHLVGKVVMIWFSAEPGGSWANLWERMRWERMFTVVE